ncbi:pyridoxal-phosphate dependent enzyme [Actinobacteria bacterium YIM 96077]|uniref:threonine ammonia-lyase n=2 Tax=Phytoactinopolyspora halophila TaxID=1981511 RepID=A0A329R327_9ACTN|nr:pyridoxal-phosphate dependent enzyme [Actinobacteria bacterium YIM 96077]RAW18940.1 pyridoxal-5'-phosphate-dependent protein [Phytoactinopolyspora halophila]
MSASTLDEICGNSVFLKCENFQRAGAFKARGAFNALVRLSPEQRARGVVAYSSGNHAQAVALAARVLGIQETILMPLDAPASKAAAVEGYGARIVRFDRYEDDRAALADELARQSGATVLPPFDHPHIIAGQGTAARELVDEVGELDVLLVPVSGGGLLAGSALAVRQRLPGVRLVGIEPETGDDTKRSLESGVRVSGEVPRTVADGLAVDRPGALPFEIMRQLVDEILLVGDEQIVEAMRWLFERTKLVVEPSGAVGVAALLNGLIGARDARVGVIVSGGNVSAERFARLVTGTGPGG